jgi:hypothetical protein
MLVVSWAKTELRPPRRESAAYPAADAPVVFRKSLRDKEFLAIVFS